MDKKLSIRCGPHQKGFTLIELMIALVLGLLVVLAATAMLLSTRSTYRTQDEGTRMQESARFALELVNRVVRMAGYTNFGNGATEVPLFYTPALWANVVGANDWQNAPPSYWKTPPNGPGWKVPSPWTNSQHSDLLTISYYGSDGLVLPAAPDGAILDCKGAAIGADTRSTNTFFVALASDGEPELYCDNGNASGPQALIRGVESFQVLYGVARYASSVKAPGTPSASGRVTTTDDEAPDHFVYTRADQMDKPGVPGWGSDWDNVKFVRIGMLIRSAPGARPDLDSTTYRLFGSNYPADNSVDPGATMDATLLSNTERTRLRRVVTSTITIRNRISQWSTLNP